MLRFSESEYRSALGRSKTNVEDFAYEFLPAKKAQSKMRNVRTESDGRKFSSAKEARRYQELKLMEKAGEICNLKLQELFKLEVNDVHITTYIADFTYQKKGRQSIIVEDVKPTFKSAEARKKYYATDIYRRFTIKSRLMKALYGIDVQEV